MKKYEAGDKSRAICSTCGLTLPLDDKPLRSRGGLSSRKMKHLGVRKMFCYIESMSIPRMITKTLKLRIKERHAKVLQMMASQVNQVRRSRMP